MKRRILMLLALGAAGLLSGGCPAPVFFAPDPLTIDFTLTRIAPTCAEPSAAAFVVDAALSADGRVVAYSGNAASACARGANTRTNVYLVDVPGQGVTAPPRLLGADARAAAISAAGDRVVFLSGAAGVYPGKRDGVVEPVCWERSSAATRRILPPDVVADGPAIDLALSGDGRFVAFTSLADTLVATDRNGLPDVFVVDLDAATIECVSVSSAGAPALDASSRPSISGDGRFVAFESRAANLAPGDTNGARDIFVHDRTTRTTLRIVSRRGIQGNGDSFAPQISADGEFVAFTSLAGNLVDADLTSSADVLLWERATGRITTCSVDEAGRPLPEGGGNPAISADGRFVAFEVARNKRDPLLARDFVDADLLIFDRQTGRSRGIALNAAPATPRICGEDVFCPTGLATVAPRLSAAGCHILLLAPTGAGARLMLDEICSD